MLFYLVPTAPIFKERKPYEEYIAQAQEYRILNDKEITAIRQIEHSSKVYSPFILLSEVERYQNVYRLKSPEWNVVKEKKSPEDHNNFNYYVAFLYDDVPLRIEISPFLASYFSTTNIFYDKFNEYIFLSYFNHQYEMILLTGFPDIPSSLPHL